MATLAGLDDVVHDGGAVVDDRLDLPAVDEFGDGCAAVATSHEICSIVCR